MSSNFAKFQSANQTQAAWIKYNADKGNSFALSLYQAVEKYGNLTVRQAEAVNRNVQSEVSRARHEMQAPPVSQDKLMQAFDTARQNKLIRLKIRFDGFFCYPASEHSQNVGAIYVKNSETKEYLGKIQNGRFVKSRDCSEAIAAGVVKVMSDPLAEAIAYGKQTGDCAICGRFLENPESVARGIGPICAAKYGFA